MILIFRTKRTAAILIACCCIICVNTFSQIIPEKKLLFESITIDDGLSQGMVNSIMQDRYGFMWFATKDGLNRYDGYNFVVYRHDVRDKNSLADNYVYTVFEDSKGRIWVGTASQGLDLFNRETETFTHFNHDEKNDRSICDNYILEIKEDKEGVLYVSTINGLCIINEKADKTGKENFSFTVIDKRRFCKVFTADKGRVWVSPSDDALYTINKQKDNAQIKTTILPEKYDEGSDNPLPIKHVEAFAHDSVHHAVYLVRNNGILKYDEATGRYQNICGNIFNAAFVSNPAVIDTSGILWISKYGKLLQYNVNTRMLFIIKVDNPRHDALINSTNCIFMDRSGNIWIGTAGYGLLKYNAHVEKFHRTENGSVRWLKEDNAGKIMVIMKGNVAWLFDKKTGSYTGCVPDSSFIGQDLYKRSLDAVEQDQGGIYWLGMQKFLRYDAAKKRVGYLAFDRKFSFPLCISRDDLIWMGTDNSFCSYNKKTRKFTHYPFPVKISNEPYKFLQAIYRQNDHIFWLGTVNGLFRFDKNEASWKQFNNNPADTASISFDVIFSLYADPVHPDKYLWIGTNGGGLNRFDFTTEKFLRYSTKDGLPNDVVYGILSDDDGNLWMSTNRGLSKFNPATGSFHNYETRDGLQSNEFNRYAFCKAKDGTLFFGGVNGFNYFRPRELSNNTVLPKIVITDFKIGNRPVTIRNKENLLQKPVYLTDKIILRYEYNMISFDFAAMDFSQPEKNLYQYKLEGFDKEWIQSGTHHTATYTNLDPGTYFFRVKGSNSDGVWNETGTFVQLIILPPWYMSWWFRALIIIIILSAAYAFYRYRLAQALQLQAVRNRIASDLHDEIGSNLSNISIFSNVAQQRAKAANENTTLLQKITEYAQTSMDAMSDIVWMINARNDRFENIIVRMRSLAAELFEATECALHIHFDEKITQIKLSMEERKNFYLIYKEALNNIAKYAGCKDVWINMKIHHNRVVLSISDNGKGFDLQNSSRGNGLFNMRKRAEMLKGKLTVTSAPGAGTAIELEFES